MSGDSGSTTLPSPGPPARVVTDRESRLRKLVAIPAVALGLALVAGLGAFGPAADVQVANAATAPKVVIIVGAVHGSTERFRQSADRDYAEAIKYTPNVVKVYSPNATWSAVKAAVAGASVVIYRGHGNGWPSPYTFDPNYTTKNGFGLNSVAGQGDYNNKYYGEPYIDDLELAPDAVILLHGLCYASGNSEPGHAEPSLTVAKQRVDNYASAFLKAGAAAVIAGGKESAAHYLNGIFTTRQTLDEMWRAAPSANDNTFSFESVRSPGLTAQMDPEEPTSGYYRAITGSLQVRTEDVIGAGDLVPSRVGVDRFPKTTSLGGSALWGTAATTSTAATTTADALNTARSAAATPGTFVTRVNDTTPKRGQTITLIARTAAGLSTRPRVRVEQPGIAAFTVTMTRLAPGKYKASVRFRPSAGGTVRVRVSAHDTEGKLRQTYLNLRLR